MPEKKIAAQPKKAQKPSKTALRIERAQIAVPHPGYRFGYKHHVFIAKLKRGEIWALNHLKSETKIAVTPLLEMWPPKPATPTKPSKTLTDHTVVLMQVLATEWTGLPCYVDTQYLQAGGGPSPTGAQTVFAIARTLGVNAVPVTSPYFSQAFQQIINNVVAADGRGVMFRLPVNFFNDVQNISGYLDGLSAAIGVSRNQVDILIDLAHRPNVVEVQQIGSYCLNNLPNIGDWRTVTLAAGCFPDSITDEPAGTWIEFNRSDWNGWRTVATQRATAHLRVPTYGDYGVRCGGTPVFIPNSPAPNIRYTVPEIVWVRKGQKVPGSTRAICLDLVNQQHFSGAQFSQGDADIAAKAAMTSPANGSPEQWIQWCTNHHIELTASQIQSLP
jgi:hypothetical protein